MLVNVPLGTLVSALSQVATVLPVEGYCEILDPDNYAYVDVAYGGVTERIKIGACVGDYPAILERGAQPRAFPKGACATNVEEAVEPEPEECPEAISLEWGEGLPPGSVNDKYSACFELADGDYEIGEAYIPDGFEVASVGNAVCLSSIGLPERIAAHPIRIQIMKGDCVFANLVGELTIDDPCYVVPPCPVDPVCSYQWYMQPAIVPVGTPIDMFFQPPADCPAGTVLVLDVFESDGVTPYEYPPGSGNDLQITLPPGHTTYTPDRADADSILIFKPATALEQSLCIRECTPSIPKQTRIVLPAPPCNFTWGISPTIFQAGDTNAKTRYAASGPAGCSILIRLFQGDDPFINPVTGQQTELLLNTGQPVEFITTWPADYIGEDMNWRPAPDEDQPACAQGCTIQPPRIDFDVVGNSCVINWGVFPPVVTVGQQTGLEITSGPPNCAVQFQGYTYESGGVTEIPGAIVWVQTDATGKGAAAKGACTTPGFVIWKPVSPQPNACAQSCVFSVQSAVMQCVGEQGTGTCGLQMSGSCTAPGSYLFNYAITGLVSGQDYDLEVYTGTAWVGGNFFTASGTTKTDILNVGSAEKLRVVKVSDPACKSNELLNPCLNNQGGNPQSYYCVAGNCAAYSSAPAGGAGPYLTLGACQASCGGNPGTCVAKITAQDQGSPTPPCGTSLALVGTDDAAWSQGFTLDPGVTASATGMPSGMTGTTSGSTFLLSWATPVPGTYNITVTGTKAGCTNCSFPVTLTISDAGSDVCASLSVVVQKGSSAYTPQSSDTFNAANQQILLTVTGTPGKTFVLTRSGSMGANVINGTIPAGGTWSQTLPTGQAGASWLTTWVLTAGGIDPISSVCSGASSRTIYGNTCVKLSIVKNTTNYTIYVNGPAGAIGVPFTLGFGGEVFGGSNDCDDNTFGYSNSGLTTNSGGGGDTYYFTSGGSITGAYHIAVKLSLNAGTSALTHQLCGTTCLEVVYT